MPTLHPGPSSQDCDDKKAPFLAATPRYRWTASSAAAAASVCNVSEPHRPLPHLEQRLSAWRCGCPAAPSTCHRQPNALFHFPPCHIPSPHHRTRYLHLDLHSHLGLRDRWTQDQRSHSHPSKRLSFCHHRCSWCGVAVAGQWAWLLFSPSDDLPNYCTLRQSADWQREGWEDTGNDERRGGEGCWW